MNVIHPRISNPIVGKFYNVPCIQSENGKWFPILGPKHEDADYIRFPTEHYHFDFRFITNSDIIRQFGRSYHPGQFFGSVATAARGMAGGCYRMDTIKTMRRKCIRQMPEYPIDRAIWLPQLEAAYADKKMKCMTCPHRGIPLDGLPVKDGVVTCPVHGLRWNVTTGELVRSAKSQGQGDGEEQS